MPLFSRLLAVACFDAAFSSPLLADAGHSHGKDSFGVPGKDSAKARVVEVSMDDGMRGQLTVK